MHRVIRPHLPGLRRFPHSSLHRPRPLPSPLRTMSTEAAGTHKDPITGELISKTYVPLLVTSPDRWKLDAIKLFFQQRVQAS